MMIHNVTTPSSMIVLPDMACICGKASSLVGGYKSQINKSQSTADEPLTISLHVKLEKEARLPRLSTTHTATPNYRPLLNAIGRRRWPCCRRASAPVVALLSLSSEQLSELLCNPALQST